MKRGVWVGVAVLILLGWASELVAQDVIWRRVRKQPATVRMSDAELEPSMDMGFNEPVQLGKPKALPLELKEPTPVPPPQSSLPADFSELPVLPLEEIPPAIDFPSSSRAPTVVSAHAEEQSQPEEKFQRVEQSQALEEIPVFQTEMGEKFDPNVVQTAHGDWQGGVTPAHVPPPWVTPAYAAPYVPPPMMEPPHPREPHFYTRAEYLLWWIQQDDVPVLVTTSTNPNDFGILGQQTTQILFGGDGLDRDPRSGGRFFLGWKLDKHQHKAVEIGGFFLGERSTNFQANSAMTPLIGRPFFADNLGSEFAELAAFPGLLTGNVTVNAPSRLWGLEGNLRCKLFCGCNYGVSFLVGARYLDLDESITITENVLGLANNPDPTFQNQRITVVDRFATENDFVGGQVGVESRHVWGRWNLDLSGKLALGTTHQRVRIDGSQQFVDANGMITNFQGGLLALRSNIGEQTRRKFSVVPEVGVRVGYQVTDHLRATLGYNFMYWSNVARPGDQIDRTLDITQIPNFRSAGLGNVSSTGATRPAVPFNDTGLWVQGLNFGLEFVW